MYKIPFGFSKTEMKMLQGVQNAQNVDQMILQANIDQLFMIQNRK